MHLTGKLVDYQATNKIRIVLDINERTDGIEKLQGEKLKIDICKFREHRSLDANAYFWQLVDKIGKVLGLDKWVVYLMQLNKWGVFVDVTIKDEAYETLQEHFRYTEILKDIPDTDIDTGNEFFWYVVRCYYGSSDYNSKEMSDLINGTVIDAKDLGIETETPDEIARMISIMKAREQNDRNMAAKI